MRKKIYITIGIIGIAIIFYLIGYFVATWKLNCCAWGEGCERNIDAELCDSWLGFPQDQYQH